MEAETKRSFRILIVEDDPIDVKLLKRQLSQSQLSVTKVEQCDCLKDALEQLSREQCDVVLLDMSLPDSEGLETLTAISNKYPHLTIITVTSSSDEETALRALANGSQDYLIKCRFDPYALSKSIQYSVERKKNEMALLESNKELKKANHEMKMMQSQLVQNEKLASIGQLAAGVAHEMNTPVGFVVSNFTTLRKYIVRFQAMFSEYEDLIKEIKKHKDKKYEDKIKAIEQSWYELKMDFIQEDIQSLFNESSEGLERITSIIQNLRDFSHIDKEEDFSQHDLNRAIKATLTVAKNEIKYDAEIQTDLCETLPVWCNRGQVNQVFLNILVNAAQAIKLQEREEKGNISIKTYKEDSWGVCEISDDGPGIPQSVLNKIFDPFFTTKPVGKGTGLGLSISHDIIVNKHKGRLCVESEIGKGTRFTIKLPLSREEQQEKILVESGTDG